MVESQSERFALGAGALSQHFTMALRMGIIGTPWSS